MHGKDIEIKFRSIQEHREEKLYILSRPWKDGTFYVANLPGEITANSDYGYVTDSKKARPLSEHWKKRFIAYCASMGVKAQATPLSEKQSSIESLLKRPKSRGMEL